LRSIEEVLRIKKRKLDDLQRDITTLEAAAAIMDSETVPGEPVFVSAPGISDSSEPRGIPNLSANPMATQPPPRREEAKRWP